MKKLLGILVLGLLWCNIGVASDYKSLSAKAKVATKEQMQEIINNTILALDLETGIAESCIYELKATQEFGQRCEKFISRKNAINNLVDIYLEPNFKNRLMEIATSIDKGEKLSYLNPSEFMSDYKEYSKSRQKACKLELACK